MFYHLFKAFTDVVGPFRIFLYPSFRIPAAMLTALVITLVWFPRFIAFLKRMQQGAVNVREDTPAQHQAKGGTPTMGGLFILLAVSLSTLLWAELSNLFIWMVLIVLLSFGGIGLIDDYRKLKYKNSKGLSGKKKLLLQVGILSFISLGVFILNKLALSNFILDTHVSLPFVAIKWFNPDFGLWYLPFAFLVVMGTSHAVNLTDGLDGLAIAPTVVSSLTFLGLSYIAGLVLTFKVGGQWVDFNLAEYLNTPHIAGSSELGVICAAMAGAGIGFLWYNAFPATVFMGDVGSLALGGALGAVAVLTKNEILSAIIHGVFLMEALSVIAQVLSFKWRGKRVFKMAPIHHHFELKGYSEPKIIVRFWIISVCLALAALVSLKLR